MLQRCDVNDRDICGMTCRRIMAKQHFDYFKTNSDEYRHYGFHLKNGRIHIDTKRLKECGLKSNFPELFSAPRNTHYFIPKHKSKFDYSINYLVAIINELREDWFNEYIPLIKQIKSPDDVYDKCRIEGLSTTTYSEDYDSIEVDSRLESFHRIKKYNELVKSIRIQYLIRSFTEYLRAIYLMLIFKDYKPRKDFQLKDLIEYVDSRFSKINERSQIELLPHYLHLNLANKLCNFLKHHSHSSYAKLANSLSPYKNEQEFYASYVYPETYRKYETGMYAGDWVKIDKNFIPDLLDALLEFSKELCKLLYNENYEEAIWNSDDQLIKRLKETINLF